jgi:hypothetical protein
MDVIFSVDKAFLGLRLAGHWNERNWFIEFLTMAVVDRCWRLLGWKSRQVTLHKSAIITVAVYPLKFIY